MTTSNLAKPLTIEPHFRNSLTIEPHRQRQLRRFSNVDVVNLKPIRTKIEQAIKSFRTGAPDRSNPDIVITSTTNKMTSKTVEITISVDKQDPPPNGGTPAHPPKRVILWGV
jgi:hypothetical protein